MTDSPRLPPQQALLRAMFDAAIASAQAARCVPAHLPEAPRGRLVVIGAGKASAAMAQAVEAHWRGPLTGVVVTRYGHAVPCRQIEIIEAAHPVPDAAGERAAQRLLQAVQGLAADDLVLCLFSGGGSSLLPPTLPGVSLAELQALTAQLLASGASISEINCVRRHLSAFQGGRLALACRPARVLNLLLSDVPGDDPVDIASGPTVPDPSRCADALAILRRHGIEPPAGALALLSSGEGESIKPGDPRLPPIETRLIATPQQALEAAAEVARAAGYTPHLLGDALEGEAREVASALAGIALNTARRAQPFVPPCVLLSGGETTVRVRGRGEGGRNVEFLLALALALKDQPGVHALAGDTDGVDGQGERAGAWCSPGTLARAWQQGLNPRAHLDHNDGHRFFSALGQSVLTGPTLTNVNDFRAILIEAPPG